MKELTEAEVRVAKVVAEGYTNRETAKQLGISQHTVVSHLRSVFTKLGVNDRAAMADALGKRNA